MAVILTPNRVLNRSFLRNHETMETKNTFREELNSLLTRLDDKEDEEHNKTWIRDFLTHTFYGNPYQVNTSKKVDQAIFGPDGQHPWVLMERNHQGIRQKCPGTGTSTVRDSASWCSII